MNCNSPSYRLCIVKYLDSHHQAKEKIVKNLSWLLTHAQYVKAITIFPVYSRETGTEAIMQACLVGGEVYRCGWADFKVMVDWLNARHSFRNIHIAFYLKEEVEEAQECSVNEHHCQEALHLVKVREAVTGMGESLYV